jgi:hypothetical protein
MPWDNKFVFSRSVSEKDFGDWKFLSFPFSSFNRGRRDFFFISLFGIIIFKTYHITVLE